MCKEEKYINIQNGEELDLNKVNSLPDNAMLKIRPELFEVWDFEKNDEFDLNIWNMTKGMDRKATFYCGNCEEALITEIRDAVKYNVKCKRCKKGKSYNERALKELLDQLNVKFNPEAIFNWSGRKRYDFYIPSINMIIETHGRQHTDVPFRYNKSKSVKEEQENDRYKKQLAKDNGVSHYKELILKKSHDIIEFKKECTLKLDKYFDLNNVNWTLIHDKATENTVKKAVELWNKGMDYREIGSELNLHHVTISRYILESSKIGLCKRKELIKKKVVKLDLKGNFLEKFNSIIEASDYSNKNKGIHLCCKGKIKSAYGYNWMYESDYLDSLKYNSSLAVNRYANRKEIVMIKDNVPIKIFDTAKEASDYLSLKISSHIIACCRGKRKTAGGYIWTYKDDYDKYIEEQKQLA